MRVICGRMFAKQIKTYNNGSQPEENFYLVSCIN